MSPKVSLAEGGEAWEACSLLPRGASAYWRAALGGGSERWAPNLGGRQGLAWAGQEAWPYSVLEPAEDRSYVASLRTQYLIYPRGELGRVSDPHARAAAEVLLDLGARLAGALALDRVVQWSDWLLSTNPHPRLGADEVEGLTEALIARYPQHALLLRCVDEQAAPGACGVLERLGYLLVPSRVVHYFDGREAAYRRKSTYRRDARALRNEGSGELVCAEDIRAADATRVAELYTQIYIDKHSRSNTRYLPSFFARAIEEGWLRFLGLRGADGSLSAVLARFDAYGVQTVPMVGYERASGQSGGLYHRLVLELLEDVASRRLLLNYSSGADEFKRRRGSIPVLEWNALYVRHLPVHRRLAYGAMTGALRAAARPVLEAILRGEESLGSPGEPSAAVRT